MNFAHKTLAAAVGGLMVVLLAGCAGSPNSDAHSSGTTTSNVSTPAAQAKPEQREVRGLKVIDPTTVVVTPTRKTDSLYGKDFTVHIKDIATPTKGQCGYDQALALAQRTVVGDVWILQYSYVTDGVYIDSHGDHYGRLDSRGSAYGLTMVRNGMAYVPTGMAENLNVGAANDAKAAGTGLWTSCPGFGA